MIQTNPLTKQKVSQRPREQSMVAKWKDGGRDSYGVWGRRVHTAVLKMDNQQGPIA